MDHITVYTKKRCAYCISSKHWLQQRGYPFTEICLDDTGTQQEFIKQNPSLRSVPQIFMGDEIIGGFSELIKSKLA